MYGSASSNIFRFADEKCTLTTVFRMQVKEESPYKNTFVYTHCNGNSGYLGTDIAYKEGGNEPMVFRTMPGTEKKISGTFREMNNEL